MLRFNLGSLKKSPRIFSSPDIQDYPTRQFVHLKQYVSHLEDIERRPPIEFIRSAFFFEDKEKEKKYIFEHLSSYKESLCDRELVKLFDRLLILHKKDLLEMLCEIDPLPVLLKKIFFNDIIPQTIRSEEDFIAIKLPEKATKMLLKGLYCYAPDVLQRLISQDTFINKMNQQYFKYSYFFWETLDVPFIAFILKDASSCELELFEAKMPLPLRAALHFSQEYNPPVIQTIKSLELSRIGATFPSKEFFDEGPDCNESSKPSPSI